MAPLSANFLRPHKVHQRATNDAPANAGEKFYTGGFVLREAATGLVTKVVAAGNVPLGVTVEPLTSDDPLRDTDAHLDNTSGADGSNASGEFARCVRYDQVGEYAFAFSGGTPVVQGVAYLVDDTTVSANDPGHGIAAGVFTRPCDPSQVSGGWFVDIANAALLTRLLAAEAAT